MNREDVIRMAQEAGFRLHVFNGVDGDEVVSSDMEVLTDELERFASLVAAAERDRCAKAVENERLFDPSDSADDIAYGNAINDAIEAIRKLKP